MANSPSVDGVINEFSSLTAVTTPANPFTFAESQKIGLKNTT